jgi:hypothetical protein
MCRSTWREENKIYILYSLKSYKSRFNNHFQYFIFFFNYLTNIIIVLFPIAAICRSTRRKEVIIYDLRSFYFIYVLGFECYLYENLELNIIFCTLLQKKIFKTIYFSIYYHCSSFLFPIAAIFRSENHGYWEKKNNGALIWLINLYLFLYNIFFILIMKFRNFNFLNHFMINDQYKLDIVGRLFVSRLL